MCSYVLVCSCFVPKVKSNCFAKCSFVVYIQSHCAVVKKNGASEKDTRTCCQQDQMHRLAAESEHMQNGSCMTDLQEALNINGFKKNGHCTFAAGNGTVTNGHIKSGQCLVANESDHLVKNGFQKNGHWKVIENDLMEDGCNENRRRVVVRRRKDRAGNKGGSSGPNDITENELYSQQSLPQIQVSHVPEPQHVESHHIKVCF